MWLVCDSAQTFSFVSRLCMVPGEAFALASVTVPVHLDAISWRLTTEDQAFPNLSTDLVKTSCARFWSSASPWHNTCGWRRCCCTVADSGVVHLECGSVLIVFGCLPTSELSPRTAGSQTCNNWSTRHLQPRRRSRNRPGQSCRV